MKKILFYCLLILLFFINPFDYVGNRFVLLIAPVSFIFFMIVNELTEKKKRLIEPLLLVVLSALNSCFSQTRSIYLIAYFPVFLFALADNLKTKKNKTVFEVLISLGIFIQIAIAVFEIYAFIQKCQFNNIDRAKLPFALLIVFFAVLNAFVIKGAKGKEMCDWLFELYLIVLCSFILLVSEAGTSIILVFPGICYFVNNKIDLVNSIFKHKKLIDIKVDNYHKKCKNSK